jgi:hypothetical protein
VRKRLRRVDGYWLCRSLNTGPCQCEEDKKDPCESIGYALQLSGGNPRTAESRERKRVPRYLT